MQDRFFDDLTRALVASIADRRRFLASVVSSAAVAQAHVAEPVLAGKQRRRRRRRRNKRKVQVCHDGQLIRVPRQAVEAHLQHGDQLGSCDLPQGTQTCENPKLPCNVNPTFCGGSDSGCACFVTTIGGSICANNSIECLAGGTCTVDQDCVDRLGDGYYCVPTLGCEQPGCTATGNACTQVCQAQD